MRKASCSAMVGRESDEVEVDAAEEGQGLVGGRGGVETFLLVGGGDEGVDWIRCCGGDWGAGLLVAATRSRAARLADWSFGASAAWSAPRRHGGEEVERAMSAESSFWGREDISSQSAVRRQASAVRLSAKPAWLKAEALNAKLPDLGSSCRVPVIRRSVVVVWRLSQSIRNCSSSVRMAVLAQRHGFASTLLPWARSSSCSLW